MLAFAFTPALGMFIAFVAVTLIITYFSARKATGSAAYFAAGRSITVNLGTGRGYSVLEVVRAYAQASGREIRYDIGNFESYFQAFVEFALADARVGASLRAHLLRVLDVPHA